MEVIYLDDYITIEDEICLAVGYFDGLHLGHYALLNKVIQISQDNHYKKAMLTFDHHPSYILDFFESEYYLESFDDRVQELEKLGFDYLFVVPFSKTIARFSADEFIKEFIQPLNVKHVVCGFDFTFGNQAKGNAETLKKYFNTSIIDEVKYKDEKVSSSINRALLKEGHIEDANQLLNKPYMIKGKVVKGRQIGRVLGFPTANIDFKRYVLPKRGVYASYVYIDGKKYLSMTNIGKNPTITDLVVPSLEVHIFDFDEDIYNKTITVEFVHFIRDEVKFTNSNALINQLNKDKNQIQEYFKREC